MDQLKKSIQGLLLLGMLSVQAQVTNTGEMTVVSGTQVGTVSDFENSASGSVHNNGELHLYADYRNEGSFSYLTPTGGTVRFQGSSVQQISGNGTNSFYSVDFDNPSGPVAFELGAAIRIGGTANFIQGIVKNDSFSESLIFGPTAGHTGASMSGFVDGIVQKEGASAFTFPFGDGGFHRAASISAPKNVDAVFASRYILENSHIDYPHNVFVGNIGFINDMEYWILNRPQGSSEVVLTLTWDSATTPAELLTADASEVHIVRWDPKQGAWVDEGGVVKPGNRSVSTTVALRGYGVFTLAKVSSDSTDTDEDGVPDFVENNTMPPTDPEDPKDYTDTDGDGVPDYVENNKVPESDPNDPTSFPDEDGDGIPDYIEDFGTEGDGDGVPDYIELTDNPPTDPDNPKDFTDADGDGVPDYVETNGDPETGPNDPTDFVDSDGDGAPDYVEINSNPSSDPNDPADFVDSDGDGVPDYAEINGNPPSNPNYATDFADADGDGISDYTEGGYIQDDILIENDLVSKSQPSGFFEIVNIERFPDNTVEIFNRNGIKVFSINGYDNNARVFRGISNGRATLLKGDGLPTGVYFYIIRYAQEGNGRTRSGYLYVNQ